MRELTPLARPFDAAVHTYLGKQLDKQRYAARVHRLGAGGVELTSDAPLTVFSAVCIHLSGLTESKDHGVDGKVVALGERDGVRTVVVRFTGLGWIARDELAELARTAGESTSEPTG